MHEQRFPTSTRRMSFNDGWTFSAGRDVLEEMMGDKPVAREISLPHDAMRDNRSPNALSGALTAFHSTGSYHYSKEFDVPMEWADKVVVLEFEGVYRDARVFINNVLAGGHQYGYTGFTVNADAHLIFGATNTVVVEARTHLDARWYSGGGIYRPVFLHVLEPVHIELDGVEVTTPVVSTDFAMVEVVTTVVNTTRHTRTVRLETALSAPGGNDIASDSSPVTLLPGQRVRHHHRLPVTAPELWSVDSPALYSATTTLTDDGARIDQVSTGFGIRSLQLDSVHGLRINGEVVKLRGGAVHADNGPLGAATVDRASPSWVAISC